MDSEPQTNCLKINVSETNTPRDMSMKARLIASERSLIECAKGLMDSHLYSASGALRMEGPKEIIVYVIGMNGNIMDVLKHAEASTKEQLPRFDEEGERHDRDYHCILYKGDYFGLSKPMQSLEIYKVDLDEDSDIDIKMKRVDIEGTEYGCLVITKLDNTDRQEPCKGRSYNLGEDFEGIEITPVDRESIEAARETL